MEEKIKVLARILNEVVNWLGTMEDQISDMGSEVDFVYESDVSPEEWVEWKKVLLEML